MTITPAASYNAICRREGDWWVVTVPELESGGVTQVRSLEEVPDTVADLVALMTGANPATIEVAVQSHTSLTRSSLFKIVAIILLAACIAVTILVTVLNHASVGIANWVAIGAALIALITVYFSAQSSGAAVRAARVAEEQLRFQWQLRTEAAQPYVWVDVRPDDVTGRLLNLVVGNSGQTSAENVRVEVAPSLPAIDQLKDRAAAAQDRLAAGLSSLPPGRVLTWPLGQGFNLLSGDTPKTYTFTINADGPFGPMSPRTYTVDLDDLRGTLDRPSAIYQLTKAVEDLKHQLEK